MKALVMLFISVSVFAHSGDCINCNKPAKPESTFIRKLMNWFSTADVNKAPCKTKKVPTEDEMRKFIAGKLDGAFSLEVNGVHLQDESPVLVQAFIDFTTQKDSFGSKVLKNEQKNIQHEFDINPDCVKALCAMEKIWGKEAALKMLYVKLKHGFNMSEIAFQDSSRFKKDEMDDVIRAVDDLPPALIPLAMKNQRLTMYTRGSMFPGYEGTKTQANSVVMLFDAWAEKYTTTRQYTIFHELSHNISYKLKDLDENPEWLALSGWVKKGDEWEAAPGQCFISNYAKANAWEDFAETLSAYRYNGNTLKKTCPAKYQFMKDKVMNGLEYLSETTCKP